MTAIAATRPMVDRVLPNEGAARLAAYAALVIAGTGLLWLSAKVHVPFWPVPMNLQTMAVAGLAAIYGWRLGAVTVALYLLEGALGAPVFTGTPQQGIGLAYLLGPTGGYLLAMPLAAALIGWLAERGADRNLFALFAAMTIGDAIVFAAGFAWLAWFAILPNGAAGIGAPAAFTAGVLPFLLGDIVKIALAASLVVALRRVSRA